MEERDDNVQLSTTTVSSVAIQAGDSRIVISVLKCGKLVELQLAEAIPNLFEIGTSQDETKKLLEDHEMLLGKLKSLEDHVWDLLNEADKTAEENKDQSQVYDAMAATLKDAWDSLLSVLENRRALLRLASEFFGIAQEFASAIDQAQDFLNSTVDLNTVESITEHLHQLKRNTKALLERSLALLNKSHKLTELIELFKSNQPVANSEMIHRARSSCLRIDNLMEMLQDRRRQLDKHLRQQHLRMDKALQVRKWQQQEGKVTNWLRNQIEVYLKDDQLGASLTENEELLHKHKQFVIIAKEWTSIFEKLKTEAAKLNLLEDSEEKEKQQNFIQNLIILHTEFCELMDKRQARLQEANDFFRSVNKAFDKLGNIETYLRHLKTQDLSLPLLSQKQSEAEAEMNNCTSDAFLKGQALIKKSSFNSGMTGVQEIIGYLQQRVDQLTDHGSTSMEHTLRKPQIDTSVEDHFEKVMLLIQKISADVERCNNPGWSLDDCQDVLNRLVDLTNQTKDATKYLKSTAQIFKEGVGMDSSDTDVCRSKACLLDEKLKTLDRSIEEKLEVLNSYISFLKSSDELKPRIQSLKKLCASSPEEMTEVDMKAMLESADVQLQHVLNDLFSVQDMGQNCLNIIKMMDKNIILKEMHVETVESTIDYLNKQKTELSHLCSVWQLHAKQVNSTKQHWRTIKEQMKSASNRLQELEKDLQPLSSLSLDKEFQNILNAQETLKNVKAKFQHYHADIEYAVKISDLLNREGTTVKEKSENQSDLVQHYQKVIVSIKEYEDILIKILAFYQVKTELENLKSSTAADYFNASKIYLQKTPDQTAHIQNLYKLILTLGMEIVTTIHHSTCLNIPLKDLQQQLDKLEHEGICWNSSVVKQEENLLGNVYTCPTKEDVNELKESFKDLKKKFNNLKFNYTKKAEKGRNLKAITNQIQQIEMFVEKYQILRKKVANLENKIQTSIISQQVSKADDVQEAIGDLQKQVNDFNTVVEAYKQNLTMAENLQHLTEESQFWCEEACSTVVRVGRYSAECKTKESVEVLLKQFNKFVQPTVSQQEERIQQITSIAKSVYGPDEGLKYVEKTVTKHKETLQSVDELCTYLKELEEKLEEPQKFPEISISDPSGEAIIPEPTDLLSCAKDGSVLTDAELQPDSLAEDAVSGDEYECISPDDISLPPLAETPESNLLQSETEQDEQHCYSSHGLHVSSYSLQMQINTSAKRGVDGTELLTPVSLADTSNHKRERTSSYIERFCSPTVGYKVESPFVHHPTQVQKGAETSYR
ncbi:coiled-coil domain-containing protein 141 isoform X2 [Bombina bombina]|uniref:coiled-coil domain-containing protein 141 isoform X2 n=1 Tax=Bombina bombina TaxID=8345 RepID=UPI00235ACA00|nr:coiled-coil domain-containing protein 141 isoform X2 [Bombina bombina]